MKKLNVKNSFQIPMPNVELLNEYIGGKYTEEEWRKFAAALDCETKIFALRTDSIQQNLDQMIQGLKIEKVKSSFYFKREKRLGDEEIEENEADDLVFQGGKEFIYEDDSYLDFNPEDAELRNNPVFNYLGTTFDKEGVRGLQINNLDVGSCHL